ncbi:20482_t:CDS:2 [Gigaspora margarita]|uniref:20482_t:CDS:1 n=1 Tax=Gigaspora margarita TaxID=4874 RepID=A0ABM8VYS8_GIGMA|nr:20482_t:CDS:2 [Gigaspora margarita]
MENTVNKFLEMFIDENQFINKHDYNLFSDFKIISETSFGTVRTAKWNNSIIVLKSLKIDTDEIISSGYTSGINNDTIFNNTKNERLIRAFINEVKFNENIRLSFTGDNNISHEKWIECKINEGLITKYKFDEFTEFKMIGSGAFSIVYKTTLKITEDTYALKIIHNNKYTDKEIVNEDDKDNATLPLRISNGLREKPISDTNHKYVAIYEKCWQGMQDDRPSIQEVVMELKDIIIQDIVVQDISIQDISDNVLFDIFDINSFTKYLNASFKSQNNQQIISEPEDDGMARFVNELYSTFSNLFNEGRSVSDIIINFISKEGKTNEEVFRWLSNHDDNPKIICLLGLFYSWEIGTKKDNVNVFNLFLNAADSNDIIAQYFVGRCYEIGWNTRKNMKEAIKWYKTASQGGCAIAECMLGEYCYKLHRYEQAFNYLKSAAKKGNALAMNTLGTCYQKGYGTKVDKVKGFKSFEKAAEMGLLASQYELGDCYEYGNGTKINLKEALNWYKKASEKNPNYLSHVKRVENKTEQLRKSSITLN